MKRSFAVSILVLSLVGCREQAQSGLRTVQMPIGSKTYTLEVALTQQEQATGLMKRDSMPSDHGMIFVFPDAQERAFWMKHTRIPLDILYLDDSCKVVSTATMKPYDLTPIPSNAPARYAIELNAGQVQASGVKVGDVLSVPADARDAKE